MRKLVLVLFSFFLFVDLFSQILPYDTVIVYNKNNLSFKSINVFNDNLIEIYKCNVPNENESYVFINGKAIDSTGLILNNPFIYDQKIVFNYPKTDIYTYDFHKKILYSSIVNKEYFIDNTFSWIYTKEEDNTLNLNLINPDSKDIVTNIDLGEYWIWISGKDEDKISDSEIKNITVFNQNEILIIVGQHGEGLDFRNYKAIYFKDGEKQDVSNKYTDLQLIPLMISENKEYIKSQENFEYFIRDKKLEKIQNCLQMGSVTKFYTSHPNILGVCKNNSIITSYFLISFLDNGKKVIVQFRFIPELESAMVKVFENIKLSIEDLQQLDLHSLGLLRNLIFAKYNYDFNSDYYQAYFNLFTFYNDFKKKGKRTKEVNDNLTDADRNNIELIQKTENRR